MQPDSNNVEIYFTYKGRRKMSSTGLVTKSCKRYFNALHYLSRLSKAERILYDYLCEKMTSDTNLIAVDANLKAEFINDLNHWTGKKTVLSKVSIPSFMKKLIALHLVTSYREHRGLYQINPKYVFKGSEPMRKRLIQSEVTWNIENSLPFSHLIDKTEANFLQDSK